MAKCPTCGKKLIIAKNQTTQFQYLWCGKCRLVHKDTDMDGIVG